MDGEKKVDIMETDKISPEPSLTWRDGAIPLLALGLAALFWTDFAPDRTDWPHWGIFALVCAHFVTVLAVLGKRARYGVGSVFCVAGSLALGLSCAIYQSGVFLVMNCFAILFTAALATFALSGHLSPGMARVVPDVIALSFTAFFTRLGKPFRTLSRVSRGNRRQVGTALLAVLLAVPVLAAVLWLLSSADAVFAGLFDGLALSDLPEDAVMRVVRVLVLAPFLASALYFIREDPPAAAPAKPDKPRSAALFLPVTALLDIVYIIFCYVQIKYLFGGAEEASMSGGWAEYARSGFFQLVVITFIDLGLVLLGTDEKRFAGPGGKILRTAFALLLALTAVILFSAFWRMRLYIRAYGMSVLRLLTLWAMAVIAVSLLAAAWKLARPSFGSFRVMGGFALALWCALNLMGPVRMIADYNVDQYLAGALEDVDTWYLNALGPDAHGALARLEEADDA